MTASIVSELRRARRRRRLGELEWFEIAYRVYLAAIAGGVAVAWLSDLVSDEPVTGGELADVTTRGPALLGLIAVAAVALGLRSGSDGGPVAVEAADARHLLTAPVPRRAVLLRPTMQRLRSITFSGGLVGGIAGVQAARRLPGSTAAWTCSGTAAGALAGLAFVSVAVLAHAARLPRWVTTSLGAALLGWQAAAAGTDLAGPGDGLGSLAMWGMRTRPADLVAAAVVIAACAAALAVCDRLRLEPLTRRADLVSQLRFAVTMQDLRTVVLLRRQLRGERPRSQPWLRLPGAAAATPRAAVLRRGLRGLLRYPPARLVRMSGLAAVAGAAAVALERGTTPALAGVGIALYLLGMEAAEPLSQEVDHPDLGDGVPRERGWLFAHHLAAPGLALVPFAVVGAAVVTAAEPAHAAAAFALAVPVAWGGATGAIVSVVRDAPNPTKPSASSAAVPPEFAGFTSSLRLLWPLAVSTLAAVAVLAMRESPSAGTVVRMAVFEVLLVAATVFWVTRRQRWSAAWRRLLEGGHAERTARIGGQ